MRLRCVVVVALAVSLVAPAYAAEVRVTGTFTSLRYNSEGGDLLGTEILVVPAEGDRGGFVAFVQLAEGGAPHTALVRLKVDGAKVEFTLPEDGSFPGLRFSGVVSKGELVGMWNSGEREVLKRHASYWDGGAI